MIRSCFCRFRRTVVLSGSLAVFGLGALSLTSASAFAQRGPVQRVVQGKVTDKSNTALNGAVVYLKDDHTMSLKSYITNASGDYRFGQLSQNTDYEVWAEYNGKKSSTRTISSFDTKNSFDMDLKIDAK